jgi:hypothetical protein
VNRLATQPGLLADSVKNSTIMSDQLEATDCPPAVLLLKPEKRMDAKSQVTAGHQPGLMAAAAAAAAAGPGAAPPVTVTCYRD